LKYQQLIFFFFVLSDVVFGASSNFSSLIGVSNSNPFISGNVSFSPLLVTGSVDLNATILAVDNNSDLVKLYCVFYVVHSGVPSVKLVSVSGLSSSASGLNVSCSLSHVYFVKGDLVNVTTYLIDIKSAISNFVSSETITINNSAPTLVIGGVSPDAVFGKSIYSFANVSDVDGDVVSVVNLTVVSPSSVVVFNGSASLVGGLWISTNFTVSEVGFYNVSVFMSDGFSSSTDSFVFFSNNTLPVVSNISISPLPPSSNDTLSGNYSYSDVDGNVENGSEYRWFVSGVLQNVSTIFLLPSHFIGTNTVVFSVRVSDGLNFSLWSNSTAVTINDNNPPSIHSVSVSKSSFPNTESVVLSSVVSDVASFISSVSFSISFPDGTVGVYTSLLSGGVNSPGVNSTWSKSFSSNLLGVYTISSVMASDSSGNSLIYNPGVVFTITGAVSGGGGGGSKTVYVNASDFTVFPSMIDTYFLLLPLSNKTFSFDVLSSRSLKGCRVVNGEGLISCFVDGSVITLLSDRPIDKSFLSSVEPFRLEVTSVADETKVFEGQIRTINLDFEIIFGKVVIPSIIVFIVLLVTGFFTVKYYHDHKNLIDKNRKKVINKYFS